MSQSPEVSTTRSPSPHETPADCAIRTRRAQDAEALAELANLPGFRFGTMRLPFQSSEEARQWIENAPQGSLDLVATVDGQLVSRAGLRRHAGRRSHVGSLGMGVHDCWTDRGIGTALLGSLVDTADRWLRLRRLELNVDADNAPALAPYSRFGFQIEGRHRCFALRDGSFVDALAMGRLEGPDFRAEGERDD